MQRLIQQISSILDRSPEFFKGKVELFELNRRFLWFIVFRFAVIATFCLLAFVKPIILPHISVKGSTFLIMASFLAVMNILYWLHYAFAVQMADLKQYAKRMTINVHVQIVLDFVVLGLLVYKCGGIESPLVYFFLFHNVISCLFFRKIISFIHTALSLCIIYFISVLPFLGLITSHHFILPEEAKILYSNPLVLKYHLAGISVSFVIVWFCVANITDSLKRHQRWLQDKMDELIRMDRERTRYLLVTTHELKAPFSSIQSYVNVLLGGYAGDLSAKVSDVLKKIKIRCEMLAKMITQMLQLANINSLKEREKEIVKTPVDLMKVLGQVAGRFRESAAAKGVEILLPKERVLEIRANEEHADLLLNNVLANAVSYCYPDTKIKIELKEFENRFLLSVADTGIGIKKEDLEKVFLEFYRSEEAALANRSSTGLGLSIARQIMTIYGGRIWIESEGEVGVTVFMEFPKPAEWEG